MGTAALGLGWHHVWHFQGAVGWHGLTGWAGQDREAVVEVKATKKLRANWL